MKTKVTCQCCICGKELKRQKYSVKHKKWFVCDEHKNQLLAQITKERQQKLHKNFIKRWKNGLEIGMKGQTSISNHIRRYLFEKYNSKCCNCGWGEINPYTKKVPLEIEHIDGNYKNNQEANLRLLCPNCHSLTATFRSLNKGKGRPRK